MFTTHVARYTSHVYVTSAKFGYYTITFEFVIHDLFRCCWQIDLSTLSAPSTWCRLHRSPNLNCAHSGFAIHANYYYYY
jgi:hypothetical protein